VDVFDYSYATFNKSWFDGSKVHTAFVNPWASKVEIVGTDAALNKPFMKDSGENINIFIT